MTRKEAERKAQVIDFFGGYTIELVTNIYDDFENRTCASCRFNTIHSTNRNGCMIIEISERDMRDNFCCNRYEKKDKQ